MPSQTDQEDERDNEISEPFIAASIDKIVPLIDKSGAVHKAEEKAQKARSDLGNLYQKIETDFHGNRKAVKLIRTLITGTTDAAHDFMRTFLPLARRFELIPGEDLVDMMAAGEPPAEEEDPGLNPHDTAPRKPAKAAKATQDNAIDRHKSRLQNGDKPPAPSGPAGDTDLVDAGTSVAAEIAAQRQADARDFDVIEGGRPH